MKSILVKIKDRVSQNVEVRLAESLYRMRQILVETHEKWDAQLYPGDGCPGIAFGLAHI
jgi:hypothetical protein